MDEVKRLLKQRATRRRMEGFDSVDKIAINSPSTKRKCYLEVLAATKSLTGYQQQRHHEKTIKGGNSLLGSASQSLSSPFNSKEGSRGLSYRTSKSSSDALNWALGLGVTVAGSAAALAKHAMLLRPAWI